MQQSIYQKLETIVKRHAEVSDLLSTTVIINDQNRYRELSKEYAQLDPVVVCFKKYVAKEEESKAAEVMLQEQDAELKALAQEEIQSIKGQLENLELELRSLLLPTDPNDERNVFLEIRSGAGGDEAGIFAAELLRMYSYYIESKGWRIEVLSSSQGEHGGYKEVIARVIGKGAYSQLKFESGVHRVQRVPLTEAQGRVHTSTCTVAILPEADAIDKIDINPVDLRIDTYRSSGAGGQHVNVTDSAIRITHLPTGVVVECQDERSQHQNRLKAMTLLQARLLAAEREKKEREQVEKRRSLIGTGDRSERIRTYNFPQNRLTDHRIHFTSHNLEKVMEGAIADLLLALYENNHAAQTTLSLDQLLEM